MQFYIETERLILRDMLPEDDKGMFELDSDPLVHTYLGNNPITTIEQAQHNIAYINEQYIANGIGRWAVIEKQSGDFIGWGGIKYVNDRTYNNQTNYYDVGYRLIPRYWGKGYATEIARKSLEYAFDTMQLPIVIGTAHIDNIGSRKALEKAGLQFVEYFKEGDMDLVWYRIDKL